MRTVKRNLTTAELDAIQVRNAEVALKNAKAKEAFDAATAEHKQRLETDAKAKAPTLTLLKETAVPESVTVYGFLPVLRNRDNTPYTLYGAMSAAFLDDQGNVLAAVTLTAAVNNRVGYNFTSPGSPCQGQVTITAGANAQGDSVVGLCDPETIQVTASGLDEVNVPVGECADAVKILGYLSLQFNGGNNLPFAGVTLGVPYWSDGTTFVWYNSGTWLLNTSGVGDTPTLFGPSPYSIGCYPNAPSAAYASDGTLPPSDSSIQSDAAAALTAAGLTSDGKTVAALNVATGATSDPATTKAPGEDGGLADYDTLVAIGTAIAGWFTDQWVQIATWLRIIARKDAPASGDLTAFNAANMGYVDTGDFNPTTMSTEAISAAPSGLTAQQTRDAMKLAPTSGAPAAGSIDAELDTLLNPAGTGPIPYPFQVSDCNGNPLYNCAVSVYSDEAMTMQIAGTGTLFTSQSGTVIFNLTAGTYWFYCELSGVEFSPNPVEETIVSATRT